MKAVCEGCVWRLCVEAVCGGCVWRLCVEPMEAVCRAYGGCV